MPSICSYLYKDMNIKYHIICNITKKQHSGEHINTRKFKFRLQESCCKLMYFILFFPFYIPVTEIMEPKRGANSYILLSFLKFLKFNLQAHYLLLNLIKGNKISDVSVEI